MTTRQSHDAYLVSCAWAALDEVHRWENYELTEQSQQLAEGKKRIVRNADPTDPDYVDHHSSIRHLAAEVIGRHQRFIKRGCAVEMNSDAIAAWRRVLNAPRDRQEMEARIRVAITATAKVQPRARRILHSQINVL